MISKKELSIRIAYTEGDVDTIYEIINDLEERVKKIEKKGKKIHEIKK